MIVWILLPVLLYFFKINLLVIFIGLTFIDLLRGRALVLKLIEPSSFTTYYDENGFIRCFPENEWFINGIKSVIKFYIVNLLILPLILGYKIFLMAVFYNFTGIRDILISGILLTIITFCGEIIGQVIAIIEMIAYQKRNG